MALEPIPTWYLPDGTPIKWIDILIVSYERPEFTFETLLSIKRDTDYLHRVILVDQSRSQQRYADWKEQGLIDVLLLLDKNHGLEPAKMYGLPLVRSPLFINSDNDCLPQPRVGGTDWLTKLVKLMYENPEYAAISCPPQVFVGANRSELFANSPEIKEWDKAGGSLRLMRTDLVRGVGGWRTEPKDPIEANRSEEWHISTKLRQLGYKVGYARDIECFHMFSDNENWGYAEDVPHYHRDIWPRPSDKLYGTKEQFYAKYADNKPA
jgi:GT2 family glycosyltransferase